MGNTGFEISNNLNKLIKSNKKVFLTCLLSTLVFYLTANGLRMVSQFYISDSLFFHRSTDLNWQLSLGRWAEPILRGIFGYESVNPWLSGIICIALLTASSILICKVLRLEKLPAMIIVCSILCANRSLSILGAWFFQVEDTYILSLALAILSVWILCNARNSILGIVLSALSLAFAVGVYQSFIDVFVALIIITKARDLLDGVAPKDVIISCLKAIVVAVAAMLIYVLMVKLTTLFLSISLYEGHNGIASVGKDSSVNYLALIISAYKYVLKFLFIPGPYNVAYVVVMNYALLILAFIKVGLSIAKKQVAPVNGFLIVILAIILPLGADLIYIGARGNMYPLMEFSFPILYFFPLCILFGTKPRERSSVFNNNMPSIANCSANKVVRALAVLAFCGVFWNGAVFANGVYQFKSFEYEGAKSIATRIIDRIEQTDGYVPGQTPVLIVGRIMEGPLAEEEREFYWRYVDESPHATVPPGVITYPQTYTPFITLALDQKINIYYSEYEKENSRFSEIIDSEAVQQMPAFPQNGSCEMINEVVVVKLS